MLKAKNESWGSFLLEVAILILIVLFIRFYVFQFFRVSGPSMCPTLNQVDGQCLGTKGEFIFVNELLYQFYTPDRGEIVVFRPPNKDVYYVKRIMGIPGDTIEVIDGEIFIQNEDLPRQKVPEAYLSDRNQGMTKSSQERFTVPDGHYIVFGDNRDKSLDSRDCFVSSCDTGQFSPYVPQKNIIGRAEFVVWPLGKMRNLDNEPYGS